MLKWSAMHLLQAELRQYMEELVQDSVVFREGRADQMSKKALMDAVKSDRERWWEGCCSALRLLPAGVLNLKANKGYN